MFFGYKIPSEASLLSYLRTYFSEVTSEGKKYKPQLIIRTLEMNPFFTNGKDRAKATDEQVYFSAFGFPMVFQA